MIIKRFFLVLIILLSISSCSKKDEDVFILPEGYVGYIAIIFNQDEGTAEKYVDGKRVYEIPPSGILKTKFNADYGWAKFPEFYYGSLEGKKIPYKYDFKNLPTDSIVAFGGTTGKANRDLEGTSFVSFSNFYIGNKQQIEEAVDEASKLNYIELADE
jgi:hypothetical protein